MMKYAARLFPLLVLALAAFTRAAEWETTLENRLLEFGGGNWIIVADSGFPKHSAPGIETVATRASQFLVLQKVLSAVESAKHVKPLVLLNEELQALTEETAPGVDAYRADLRKLLGNLKTESQPAATLRRLLAETARQHDILVLKTDMTIPYSPVIIKLNRAYWDPAKEQSLRESIAD